jgi:hypothetical protein
MEHGEGVTTADGNFAEEHSPIADPQPPFIVSYTPHNAPDIAMSSVSKPGYGIKNAGGDRAIQSPEISLSAGG